jgi:hypothetical protein
MPGRGPRLRLATLLVSGAGGRTTRMARRGFVTLPSRSATPCARLDAHGGPRSPHVRRVSQTTCFRLNSCECYENALKQDPDYPGHPDLIRCTCPIGTEALDPNACVLSRGGVHTGHSVGRYVAWRKEAPAKTTKNLPSHTKETSHTVEDRKRPFRPDPTARSTPPPRHIVPSRENVERCFWDGEHHLLPEDGSSVLEKYY